MKIPRPILGPAYLQDELLIAAGAVAAENNPFFVNESSGESSTAEGFADDTTATILFDLTNLSNLKKILQDFASFSGLKCNVDKTMLMQIGQKVPVSRDILDLGFQLTEKIKILGMEIDSDLTELESNFETIETKIRKSIAYWERYNLSVLGKINIVKSLLISLLSHIGCILQPSSARISSIQTALDKFVLGKLNIARKKVCTPVIQGGLGLFNLNDFLTAQQAAWILRCENSCRDIWRARIYEYSKGNPLASNCAYTNIISNPILHGIIESFSRFRKIFDNRNYNFYNAYILNNPLFFSSRHNNRILTTESLHLDNPAQALLAAKVTFSACFNNEGLIPQNLLLQNLGFNLDDEGYELLSSCLLGFINRFHAHKSNGTSFNMIDNFCSIKKPSKKIRQLLTEERYKSVKLEKNPNFTTFFRLIEILPQELENLELCFSAWANNYGSNRYRTFLLKFYNNLLGINTRTSHFAANPNRNCTFCSIRSPALVIDESFKHLFLECTTTAGWQEAFMNKFFSSIRFVNNDDKVKFFMLGAIPGEPNISVLIHAIILTFQHSIWEQKLKKKLPSFNTLTHIFLEQLKVTIGSSRKLKLLCEKFDFEICRIFAPRPAMNLIQNAP